MKSKEVNKAIRQAFTHAVPDVLDGVLSECREQKGTVTVMTEKKQLHWGIKLAAMAAVLALIVGIGFGAGNYKINHTVTSTISLDVNPSIELRVNRHEWVLEAVALNEDAAVVLGEMDLTGSRLDVAVNAVIGSMVRNGYITELSNSVLISVDSEKETDAKALQEKLTLEISELLHTQNFDGAVLSQTVEQESELREKAKQYGITVGKAQLVDKITKMDLRYSFADLATLSVHQLNLLVDQKAEQGGGLEIVGKPSEKNYIGRDAAKAAAVKHAGLTEEQVEYASVLLEFEDGTMVYEVEFCVDGWEYDYEINAKDGTVLNSEKEYTGQEQLPIQPPDGDIGEQLAVETALRHAGLTLERVNLVNCQRDEDDGVQYYEVTFRYGAWEYAYEISAYSPIVLDWEKEQVYELTPVVPPVSDK